MGRPLRVDHAGAIHHVTARGNSGVDIFRTDRDASVFMRLLGGVVGDQSWQCLAYCLVPNHYHLVVETPAPTLSRGMHSLNAAYARMFNSAHRQVGHVFQGRFHAETVAWDGHLLETLRYVALNPVRAGLVSAPERWQWSSYSATAGLCPAPSWLSCNLSLRLFSADTDSARLGYRRFVVDGRRHVEVPGTGTGARHRS
jgi:putative transposase